MVKNIDTKQTMSVFLSIFDKFNKFDKCEGSKMTYIGITGLFQPF